MCREPFRKKKFMRFCYLVLVVAATLVLLVTTSTPQPVVPRPRHQCIKIPATYHFQEGDLGGGKLAKKGSGTQARVLVEPRNESDLVCGRVRGGGQTVSFRFTSTNPHDVDGWAE